jgi:hypothetical protein
MNTPHSGEQDLQGDMLAKGHPDCRQQDVPLDTGSGFYTKIQ